MRLIVPCVVGLACGAPPVVDTAPAAATSAATPDASASPDAPDPPVAAAAPATDGPPSVAHYPPRHAELDEGLAAGDSIRTLRGLAKTFAPHRPPYEQWDRTGHIRLAGAVTGFVTATAAGIAPQPPPTYNLSCAGGFLEGVRLLLLPEVEMDTLEACDAALVEAVDGGPTACGDDGDFGLRALANIATRLQSAQLPGGKVLHTTAVRGTQDVPAAIAAGRAKLCTVSHVSPSAGGIRLHHHMMMLLPHKEPGRLRIFDTTGSRGVSLRPRRAKALANYIKVLLADNEAFQYDPASAELTCLEVATPAVP